MGAAFQGGTKMPAGGKVHRLSPELSGPFNQTVLADLLLLSVRNAFKNCHAGKTSLRTSTTCRAAPVSTAVRTLAIASPLSRSRLRLTAVAAEGSRAL